MENFLRFVRYLANSLSASGRFKLPQSLARRAFCHAHGTVTIHDFDGDLTLELSVSEHMQRRIFWMGYYNQEIIHLLRRTLTPGMVVLDVGANIGEISLIASKLVGSSGRVIPFEPIDRIAGTLTQNVIRNSLTNVSVQRIALSDQDGRAEIFESCGQGDADDSNEGLGSLYGDPAEQRSLGHIEVSRLDSIYDKLELNRVDLIKIDAEGAELACLVGATEVLHKHRPNLIVEVQNFSARRAGYEQGDILDFLRPFGYSFYLIGPGGTTTLMARSDLRDYQNVYCVANTPMSH